ncbi:BlaI/MecI/CopY family transcriptional regulator [Paenibacillus sp. MER 180]|uniref:BlaI/MecI/CopY family transcriptional regulator n=1 Tax=Paenibacillus popilliae TaxID=78057 RepID=A0ABY3AUT1_PAEPP|nr:MULTISPECIES: BlaI/MecI/CopY family transcriptional regulator [unclassified Paenibacillus]MCM3290983.1 BlaI/MecI/CopY family transcriptional regulator [Paenibacillus sp. MER 180]OBY77450.1 transcriptional regulator [Paenibacillus sp. KS1]TQR46483.1 BlaI/MecI/CopY family transcriptional regulator [Paenibacillus sp. SDF0028]
MEKMPKISESEWEIMKVIWRENPMTAEQIVQHLPEGTDWSDQTVRTFINRLMKKKALGYQKSGRSYLYYPLISEKECVRAESRSFLNRVFNGAAGLMMTNFLEETQLSNQEIERLQQILLEKQGKESKDSKD